MGICYFYSMEVIEEWRTAVYDGEIYEGLYKVSNFGRILILNYRNTGKAELMNPYTNKDGYQIVLLSKNGKKKTCYIHRLVAQAFIPNPEGKPCINHKIEGKEGKSINIVFFNEDGNIDKERTTIEWATYEENNNYETRTERAAKAMSKRVLQLSPTGELIKLWESVNECGRNGFSKSNVCDCCNGKRKTHKGFRWEYEED